MSHVGNLGNIGIVFVGAVGLIKYAGAIAGDFSLFVVALGIVAIFISLTLLVLASISAYKNVISHYGNNGKGIAVGGITFFYTIMLGVGAIYVAANA